MPEMSTWTAGMAIPEFNSQGWLPEGIYDCTIEESARRFGVFLGSERRPHLGPRLIEFMQAARAGGAVEIVLVDGSFVSANPDRNDIDLILGVASRHDFSANLPPSEYNVLSQQRVRKRFGFDIVVVE